MLDRRSFLIGAGGLLTASFVRKATAFSQKAVRPFLLPPARKPEETLYVYCQDWKDYDSEASYYGDNEYGTNDYAAKWRVSLGPNQPFAPPVSTWREHLRSLGHSLDTREDVDRVCIQQGLVREDLDKRLNGFGWQDAWDNFTSPQARAFHLLKKLDLGPLDSALRQAGEIIFEAFGGAPGNSYTWVELKDDLTVSLLQARLIELNLPINVKLGGSLRDSA
jgi:hypothetical protein